MTGGQTVASDKAAPSLAFREGVSRNSSKEPNDLMVGVGVVFRLQEGSWGMKGKGKGPWSKC